MTKSDAALDKNTASPASSAGLPQRFAGVRATTRSLSPSTSRLAPSVSSVLIQPGRHGVGLDIVLRPAGSRRLSSTARPRPCSPRKARRSRCRKSRASNRYSRSCRPGLEHRRIDRLRAHEGAGQIGIHHCIHSARVNCSAGLRTLVPALLIRMSTRPKVSAVFVDQRLAVRFLGDVRLRKIPPCCRSCARSRARSPLSWRCGPPA